MVRLFVLLWLIWLPLLTGPSGGPSSMAGYLSVVVPEATTNLVTNPQPYSTTGYFASGTGTLALLAGFGVRGLYGIKATLDTVIYSYVQYSITLAPNTQYTFSADARLDTGTGAYQMRVYDNVAASFILTQTTTLSYSQARYSATFTTSANSSYTVSFAKTYTGVGGIITSGWQVEQKGYATTYVDGEQLGCLWVGTRHASVSTRDSQYRGGGKVVNFDTYNAILQVQQGTGMPPVQHVANDRGQLDGSEFIRAHIKERSFQLTFYMSSTGFSNLATQRKALINALKPDLVYPTQPFRLRSTWGNQEVELSAHLDTGLDLHTLEGIADETITIRFIADDPYWYATWRSAKSLAINEAITNANYILERGTNGTYHALGIGLNAVVYAAVYGPDGLLYVGGNFTFLSDGTTTMAHVAVWNGTAWAQLGAGLNNAVNALTFDGAGNLYAVGAFTNAAYPYIAVWNGTVWGPVGSAAAGVAVPNTVVYNPADGKLYVGGLFTNWNAVAGLNNLAAWDGTTWSKPGGASPGNSVLALAVRPNGHVVIGGAFQDIGGATAYKRIVDYDPNGGASQFTAYADPGGIVYAVAVDRANTLYIGGTVTNYVVRLAGTAWVKLGAGVNNNVLHLNLDLQNNLAVGGTFTTAGGLAVNDRFAGWNGTSWFASPVDFPGSSSVQTLAFYPDGRAAIGFSTAGTATTSNLTDTAITTGGTRDVPPTLTFVGPGTLESITNWTTGKMLLFNLTLQAGEYAVLSTEPGNIFFHSNLRPNLMQTILPQSDLATWRLQSGANVVLVKMSGTTTAASLIYFSYVDRFWSLDT